MARQALFQHLVISVRWRWRERYASHLQLVQPGYQVIGQESDVLDAFAIELHEEFLDLAAALLRFLVERDADHAIRRGHGFRSQTGVFAGNVEVADLAEVEQLFIEARPVS